MASRLIHKKHHIGSVLIAVVCSIAGVSTAPAQWDDDALGPAVPQIAPSTSDATSTPALQTELPSAQDATEPVEPVVDSADASDETNPPTLSSEARPLGLPAEGSAFVDPQTDSSSAASNKKTSWWLRTVLALGLVITLIVLLRSVLQRLAGLAGGFQHQFGAGGRAPSGVLEVLGRFPVARGHTLVLLKMDRRILLLGQTSSGFTPLSEVTDPEEVASLLVKTRDEEGQSMTARFNSILHEVERDQSLLDEPISIVQREDNDESSQTDDDPAASLRRRLLGLRGLEA